MTKTAYSYIRFSSATQMAGRSQARQLEACEEYCARNGLALAQGEDYRFLDAGVSGWKGDHLGEKGQLARFISLVKDGSIAPGSVLIVESLDRLSREEVTKALGTFLQILGEGIEIVTLMDQKVYRQGGVDFDLIMSIFYMSRAHEESSTKSKRVGDAYANKHALARKEKKPMGNAIPMWLELPEDKKQYVLRPDRVAVVKRIYQLSIDGYGKTAMSKQLNLEGIRSFKGVTWGGSSLDKVLNNRALLGEYQPYSVQVDGSRERKKSGDPVIGYYPVVIDEATFYQAKAAIEGRRVSGATNQSKNFNVWQGVAKCTLCHGAMHMVNKGKPPRGYTYLQCYQAKKGLCKNKVTRLDSSEMVFKEILSMLDSKSLIHDDSAKISKEITIVEAKTAEMKALLTTYAAVFAEAPTISVNTLIGRTEHDITALEKQLIALQTSLAAEKAISVEDFRERLDLETYAGRNRANTLMKKLKTLVYIGEGYIVTQQYRGINPSTGAAYKREEAVWALAHHKGKVASMPLDDDTEYLGGSDIATVGLLERMKRDHLFTPMYDYKKS